MGAVRAVEGVSWVAQAPVGGAAAFANLAGEDAGAGERVRGVAHVVGTEPVAGIAASVAREAEPTSVGHLAHVLVREVRLRAHVAGVSLGSTVARVVRVLGSTVTLEVGVPVGGVAWGRGSHVARMAGVLGVLEVGVTLGSGAHVGGVSGGRGSHVARAVRPLVHVAWEVGALGPHVSWVSGRRGSHVAGTRSHVGRVAGRGRSHVVGAWSHV